MAVLDKYNILLENKAFCTARVHPHANSQSEQVSLASWLYEHGCILVLFILRVDIQKRGFCLDILHFFCVLEMCKVNFYWQVWTGTVRGRWIHKHRHSAVSLEFGTKQYCITAHV